jgi:hypothetical protein
MDSHSAVYESSGGDKMPSQIYTIDGAITINGLNFVVNNREDAIVLRALLDAFISATTVFPPSPPYSPSSLEKMIARQESADKANYPKNGFNNTTRGFIREVFSVNRFPMYATELVEKMERKGWKSNADDKKRYVEVVMYRDKQMFKHLKGGKWALAHWNTDHPTELEADAPTSAPSDTNG